jgi:hypothetical protein
MEILTQEKHQRKQFICGLNEDRDLKEIFQSLGQELGKRESAVEKLTSALESLKAECIQISKKHWEKIEDRLRALGRLPDDYSRERFTLCFDTELEVLYLEE